MALGNERAEIREQVPMGDQHEERALGLGRVNLLRPCLLHCAVLNTPLHHGYMHGVPEIA